MFKCKPAMFKNNWDIPESPYALCLSEFPQICLCYSFSSLLGTWWYFGICSHSPHEHKGILQGWMGDANIGRGSTHGIKQRDKRCQKESFLACIEMHGGQKDTGNKDVYSQHLFPACVPNVCFQSCAHGVASNIQAQLIFRLARTK